MFAFDKDAFHAFALEHGVVQFFQDPIILRSGRKTNFKIDWEPVTTDAASLDNLITHIFHFLHDCKIPPDQFMGVPEGMSIAGAIIDYEWAYNKEKYGPGSHSLANIRVNPRKDQSPYVGTPQKNIMLVEDVITTGGKVLESIDLVKGHDTKCKIGVLTLTFRNQYTTQDKRTAKRESPHERIRSRGVLTYSMSDAVTLLQQAVKKNYPGDRIVEAIQREYQKHGIKQFTLEE
jgi:orotate phosphoribosyltransferase